MTTIKLLLIIFYIIFVVFTMAQVLLKSAMKDEDGYWTLFVMMILEILTIIFLMK